MLAGCGGTLLLPKGEQLYRGARVKVVATNKDWPTPALEAALDRAVVLPRPNPSLLGIRPRLGVYNLFQRPNKTAGFGHWVAENIGKPPVLYEEAIIAQHQNKMKATAAAHGFFSVEVTTNVKGVLRKRRLRHQIYLTHPAKVIGQIHYPTDTTPVGLRIAALQTSSLLQPGQPYQAAQLSQERERLTDSLRNAGWFHLSPEHWIFQADTIRTDGVVDIRLAFKGDVSEREKRRYRIGSITIYPDNNPLGTPGDMQQRTDIDECTSFVYSEMPIRERVVLDNIRLQCGAYFSVADHRNTLFRLMNLGFFKFVNIRYQPSAVSDSLLDAHIHLTPQVPMKAEVSASGVFSPKYYGVQAGLSWQHRNLLGAAENLRIKWEGNWIRYDQSETLLTSETQASLTLPQRIPGFRMRTKNALTATRFSVLHQLLYYGIRLDDVKIGIGIHRIEGEGGLYWKKDRQGSITHELNPLNASVQFSHINLDGIKAAILEDIPNDDSGDLLVFATQVELRPNYAFVFDNRAQTQRMCNTVFRQRFRLRGSGFLLPDAIAEAAGLGYPLNFFSETDLRQFFHLRPNTTLAYRLAVFSGALLTDKSSFSPLDLYAIGGPSSVRAYRPRQIGPGTSLPAELNPSDDGLLVNERIGNLHLLGSLELRQRLGKSWELAAFVDAGNIWLTNAEDNRTEELFERDFYKELASGAGIGLRYNLGLFILRLDVAVPTSRPYLSIGSRWVGQPGFGDLTTHFNFAFGHPF